MRKSFALVITKASVVKFLLLFLLARVIPHVMLYSWMEVWNGCSFKIRAIQELLW